MLARGTIGVGAWDAQTVIDSCVELHAMYIEHPAKCPRTPFHSLTGSWSKHKQILPRFFRIVMPITSVRAIHAPSPFLAVTFTLSSIVMNAPFPTEDAFREVCLTFLETYASFIPSLDKQRIYTGWTWREHRTKVSYHTPFSADRSTQLLAILRNDQHSSSPSLRHRPLPIPGMDRARRGKVNGFRTGKEG